MASSRDVNSAGSGNADHFASPAVVAGADPARFRASIDRLYQIFTEIALVADEVSTRRCPYKDRLNRCTAQFGCRNQRPPLAADELKICAGDDRLNYRKAWET